MLAAIGENIFIVNMVPLHLIGLIGACLSPVLIDSGQYWETTADLRKV